MCVYPIPGPYVVHTPYGLVSLNEDDTIAHGSDEAIQWLLDQKKTTQPTPINMQPETHAKPRKRPRGLTVMEEIRKLSVSRINLT